MSFLDKERPLKISLISLHGLIRAKDPELGRDADTGGQIKYVLELARELASHPNVREVELITRQIIDSRVSDDYAQLQESISDNAKIVRIPFGPKRYLKKEALWPYIEMFVDQTLVHFRRRGLPDIIHGHYADAGLAGAQQQRQKSKITTFGKDYSPCTHSTTNAPPRSKTLPPFSRKTKTRVFWVADKA